MYRVYGSFALLALLGSAVPVQGQWFEWVDDPTGVVCGLINAENVRLVQNDVTGNLILVNGTDRELVNTSVDDFGQVIIEGQFVGFVEYARDADDRWRVFWVTGIGSLYRLDTNGEPVATEIFPEEVVGDCDPCDGFWDDQADCGFDPALGGNDGDVGTSGIPPSEPAQDFGAAVVRGLCGLGGGVGLIGALMLAMTALRIARPRV